jgi:hypothetical protein
VNFSSPATPPPAIPAAHGNIANYQVIKAIPDLKEQRAAQLKRAEEKDAKLRSELKELREMVRKKPI